jgi:beta-xylosidase
VEGPFLLKRRGVYYFMWSEGGWADSSYAVAYGRAASPLGPFVREGRVLENNPAVGLGAGHHSAVQYPGTDDWYMVYHRRPLSETHGNHRVVCIDRMFFGPGGEILPVVLTHEGVPARPLPAP